MSIEKTLNDLLGPLVDRQLFPDLIPEGAKFPAIVYQQAGGRGGWYVDRTKPSHKHSRMQIYSWARTRIEASNLARLIEDTICLSTLAAEPYGGPTALHNEQLALFGARQDFGIWFPD
jgi:hypothetical protein